ncbi:hypothetical protein M513_13267 [Trichuris suis]|uniref:Uncharacterized protein n=1 Tax=Trichuris suis TaxID=68888 RepID=A0A085LLK8_9BILA|nr:hypothetical protein M513_13267 [Trichuris suis]
MAEQIASRDLALKEKVHLIRFLETNSQRKTAESSSWNKLQPEATRKCFRRAGFVRDQEDDVELRPDSPTREAEIEGVDFEDFVAIGDEAATSTEPDPQAVYQSILAEAGMSVEASSAGEDAEEESDDETEVV